MKKLFFTAAALATLTIPSLEEALQQQPAGGWVGLPTKPLDYDRPGWRGQPMSRNIEDRRK
jgi:hypothetical protein